MAYLLLLSSPLQESIYQIIRAQRSTNALLSKGLKMWSFTAIYKLKGNRVGRNGKDFSRESYQQKLGLFTDNTQRRRKHSQISPPLSLIIP